MPIKTAATFGMRGKHGCRRALKGPKCHGTGRYKASASPRSIGPRDIPSRSDKTKPTAWPPAMRPLPRQHAAKTKSPAKRSSPRAHRSPHLAFGAGFVGCAVPKDTGPDILRPFCQVRRSSGPNLRRVAIPPNSFLRRVEHKWLTINCLHKVICAKQRRLLHISCWYSKSSAPRGAEKNLEPRGISGRNGRWLWSGRCPAGSGGWRGRRGC